MSDEMIQMVLEEAEERMTEAVAHSKKEFSTIRTGRASSSIVERISVDAYGVEMKLQELASFSVPEARQLLITPHDPGNVVAIEKAITKAELGLTPSNDGHSIRLSFPELTQERRHELVRMVNSMAEEGKNRLRGQRRNGRKDLDDISGSGGVSEDDIKHASDRLDELIHKHEAVIDQARASKESELLEV